MSLSISPLVCCFFHVAETARIRWKSLKDHLFRVSLRFEAAAIAPIVTAFKCLTQRILCVQQNSQEFKRYLSIYIPFLNAYHNVIE